MCWLSILLETKDTNQSQRHRFRALKVAYIDTTDTHWGEPDAPQTYKYSILVPCGALSTGSCRGICALYNAQQSLHQTHQGRRCQQYIALSGHNSKPRSRQCSLNPITCAAPHKHTETRGTGTLHKSDYPSLLVSCYTQPQQWHLSLTLRGMSTNPMPETPTLPKRVYG